VKEEGVMSHHRARDVVACLTLLCLVYAVYAARHATLGATVSLPSPVVDEPLAASKGRPTAVLAGGCFWGVDAVFKHVRGVTSVTSGYSGGSRSTAEYEVVSSGRTGHAESVRIVYDPAQISYGQLLKVFFSVAHDPTQLNRQGPDEGPQYRSAIFVASDEQKRIAQAYIDQLNQAKVFPRPIVTQVAALTGFYQAEDYHQDYLAHHLDNPYIRINDLPKVDSLRKQFPDLYVP
jgi:peptide-methionine (S)-S-oxide reductase